MKVVIISGTPGTGKTSVSKNLLKYLKTKVITLNELVISENLIIDYDNNRETSIIDDEKLVPFVRDLIEKIKRENFDFLIIEGHFSDMVPDKFIDYAIILRCDPDELYNRLKNRGYKDKKIIENIQSEILGNCVSYFENKDIKSTLLEIDTTNLDIETVTKIIVGIIVEEKNINNYHVGKVDWLEKLFQQNRINDFFE